jgi:hypothetical protein
MTERTDAGAEVAETLPAVVPTPDDPHTDTPTLAVRDLREAAMAMEVPEMKVALAEILERRTAFREWVKSIMVEGVHYGWTPGTKPKVDHNGNYVSKKKNKQSGEWYEVKVSPEEHTRTPSLYKPGAELICETFCVRPEYTPDATLSVPGCVVFLCRLYSRSGVLIGEGHGAHESKGAYEVNRAVKMAEKRALVNAVLDTYGLSDLFTQDIGEGAASPAAHANPSANANAPTAPTRSERAQVKFDVSQPELMGLYKAWQERHANGSDSTAFRPWLSEVLGRNFNFSDYTLWARSEFRRCCDAVEAL